jgi:alkaline phosphatase
MNDRFEKPGVLIRLRQIAFCLTLILSALCCSVRSYGASNVTTGKVRYVFLFIGDGMGPEQVKLANALSESGRSLAMLSFPVLGKASTHAENSQITDSAAAGTALATGSKTSLGTISMAANHRDTLVTIAEIAKARGMKTGIVTSVGIDNATPASFYAHNANRTNYYDIAVQMASSGVDYFGGGYAEGDFLKYRRKASIYRGDMAHLMHSARYVMARNRRELMAVTPGTRCWAYTRYDSKAALAFSMDRKNRDMALSEFTREGIRLLDNPAGFFMMVEGGKIDWACHANDAAAVVHDVQAFDNAIKEALAFYRRHPKETLIVVTADHESGGLFAGSTAGLKGVLRHQKISGQRFAEKVASWKTHGMVTFPMALDSVRLYFGFGATERPAALSLSVSDRNVLGNAYRMTMNNDSADAFTSAVTGMLNSKAGVRWGSHNHTAVPVDVFAIGRGSEVFKGFYDNTDIAKKIILQAGLKKNMSVSRHSFR